MANDFILEPDSAKPPITTPDFLWWCQRLVSSVRGKGGVPCSTLNMVGKKICVYCGGQYHPNLSQAFIVVTIKVQIDKIEEDQ